MRNIIITMLGIFLIHGVVAQSDDEIAEELGMIRQVQSDTERLDAYDSFVDQLQEERVEANASTDADTGDWLAERSADPLTDETQVFFVLMAAGGESRGSRNPALVVRQSGTQLEVFINWNDYLADDRQLVTHRLDDTDPVTLRWYVSTDNTASFYPSDKRELVRKMLDAERLVARTTPYNDSPVTVTFELKGFEVAARQYEDDLPGWFE